LKGCIILENDLVNKAEKFLLELDKRCGKLLKLGSVAFSTAIGAPVAGSAFNILYSGIVDGIEKENFQRFVIGYIDKEIDEKFDEHDKKQVEIVKHAILSSLRCGHEAKIERILEILSGSLDKSLPIAEAEDLMNLVVELSENEAIIFRETYCNFGGEIEDIDRPKEIAGNDYVIPGSNHVNFSTKDIVKNLPDYNDTIDFYLNRLVGKGLLQEDTGAIYRRDGKIYQHTAIGWQLFKAFHVKNYV